jgi:hypothetical protein
MLPPCKEYFFNKLKLKKMKASLKLNKSVVVVILLLAGFCLQGNNSYAQGLLGKIKKIQEDVKKTTDDAKKIKDDAKKQVQDVKNVTGTGGNGSGGSNGNSGGGSTDNVSVGGSESNGNTRKVTDVVEVKEEKTGKGTGAGANTDKTCYSCSYETTLNAHAFSVPKTVDNFLKTINISNETSRPIIVVISLFDGWDEINGAPIWYVSEPKEAFGAALYQKVQNRRFYVQNKVTNTNDLKTVDDGGKFVYHVEAYYYFGNTPTRLNGDEEKVFISSKYYNRATLRELDYTAKIVKTTKSDALFAELKKKLQTNKDANDPTK